MGKKIVTVLEMPIESTLRHPERFGKPFDPNRVNPLLIKHLQTGIKPVLPADAGLPLFI
jgi:hypothetical protein